MQARSKGTSSFLPAPLTGALVSAVIFVNTLVCAAPIYLLIVAKLLLRGAPRRRAERAMIHCGEGWVSANNAVFAATQHTIWEVSGLEGLARDGRYLVSSNHQSWADILVLQKVFNRRIPFLKFFLKQELIWVPVIGLAWWGLDFPFMKRYSRERIERQPELRGKDLETTRRMCERFRDQPVSVINFLEGTRFTERKHAEQGSPYRRLLRPKAGGIAFVLAAMGEGLQSLLDVTIAYDGEAPTMWDFVCGRVSRIRVEVAERPIPAEMLGGDYMEDAAFRAKVQQWVSEMWSEKDLRLAAFAEAAA